MNCDDLGILLSAYMDGEVTTREKQTVEEHIAHCAVCRTTLTGFEKLRTGYQHLEIREAPAGFRQRVTERIERRPRFAFLWGRPQLAYALVCALLIVLSGALISLHFMKPEDVGQQQVSLEIEVYAEDILFDQGLLNSDEIFSVGETNVAEEILNTLSLSETDTSFFFGTQRFSHDVV